MAAYPWIVQLERQGQDLDDFPNLKHWFISIQDRGAVAATYEKGKTIAISPTVNADSAKILFGQTAETVRQATAGR